MPNTNNIDSNNGMDCFIFFNKLLSFIIRNKSFMNNRINETSEIIFTVFRIK